MSASFVFIVSRVVNSTRMNCSVRYGHTKCPAICTFLHSFNVRCNYMHTYRIFELYRQCAVVISCYSLMFKPYSNLMEGRWQTHYVPNIAHFKLLLRSDKNTFSRKSFNAVSLRVPSICPPNCAHIFLSVLQNRQSDISLACCCFMSRGYSTGSPNMFHVL
jgi:hypothetical protein